MDDTFISHCSCVPSPSRSCRCCATMSSWRRRYRPATTTATTPRATPRAVRDQMTRPLASCDDHGDDGTSHFRISTPHTPTLTDLGDPRRFQYTKGFAVCFSKRVLVGSISPPVISPPEQRGRHEPCGDPARTLQGSFCGVRHEPLHCNRLRAASAFFRALEQHCAVAQTAAADARLRWTARG